MKRIFAALICALMVVAMFVPVAAEEYVEEFLGEIGELNCPNATPAIDGSIDASEGWSDAQYMDKTNVDGGWGGEQVVLTGNFYRAYDAEYLYIAADISIPEFAMCEGVDDWIECNLETGNKPGWDGDVFVFTLDPLKSMIDYGLANEPAAWYCFGLFEGDVVRTYRTHVNDGEVTDIIPAAGARTETGWKFEAAIPWETICKDLDDLSYGDIILTPEDIVKEGNVINSAMIYYDRVMDPEAGERITGSRYVTICTTCPDGLPGISVTPWLSKAYGIYLKLDAPVSGDTTEDTTAEAPDSTDTTTANTSDPNGTTADTTAAADTSNAVNDGTTAAGDGTTKAPETTIVDVTDDKGNAVTDEKGNKVTEKVTVTDTAETVIVDVTDDKGNVVTDNKGNKVTQKVTAKNTTASKSTTKAASTGASTGGNAAQTFDIGIAVALGALAVSGVGIVSSRKKR